MSSSSNTMFSAWDSKTRINTCVFSYKLFLFPPQAYSEAIYKCMQDTKNLHPIEKLTINPLKFTFPWSGGWTQEGLSTSGLTLYRASGRIIMDVLACWLSGLLYPTADTGLFIICWLLEKNGCSVWYTKNKDSFWSLWVKHLQVPHRNMFQESRNYLGCICRNSSVESCLLSETRRQLSCVICSLHKGEDFYVFLLYRPQMHSAAPNCLNLL